MTGRTRAAGLIEHFSKLQDPRVDIKKHELIDVVVERMRGAQRSRRTTSIRSHEAGLFAGLLANGIPVDDTIARIISALSVKGFQESSQLDV